MDDMKKVKRLAAGILMWMLMFSACGKEELPKPEATGGLRGQMKIDKNINEATIDLYLNRDDSVYYDMRMLVDEATYENIGGDSYLSGFVKGFEVLPYPFLATITDLPEEVGTPYRGEKLYTIENGEYIANYEESLTILEYFFPKDKKIFLMCGGGGYAGMTKDLLVALGWNPDNIYNVGGYWYYDGANGISVKRELDGENHYDFWKVTYHDIPFEELHEVEE